MTKTKLGTASNQELKTYHIRKLCIHCHNMFFIALGLTNNYLKKDNIRNKRPCFFWLIRNIC